MSFRIKHFRDGALVGVSDRADTMYAARLDARARQALLQSQLAVILGKTAAGDEREVEVIDFTQ